MSHLDMYLSRGKIRLLCILKLSINKGEFRNRINTGDAGNCNYEFMTPKLRRNIHRAAHLNGMGKKLYNNHKDAGRWNSRTIVQHLVIGVTVLIVLCIGMKM